MRRSVLNKSNTICLLAAIVVISFLGPSYGNDKVLTISTTTSTQATGLLDVLLPSYEKDTGIKVKVIAKGTGAAIRDGRDGNVDLIFVHAKSREEQFVKDGFGTKRYGVMHNDFVILGPQNDPANIKGVSNPVAALEKIARAQSMFVSRGDDSGTHTKEQALWGQTSLTLENTTTTIVKKGKKKAVSALNPKGKWYISLGQGMGKTLTFADEKQTYILSDRGTFIKYKYGKKPSIDLVVLCEGDKALTNPYGVIPINPKKHPHVKYKTAKGFAKWLVTEKAQNLIGNYKLLNKQLFYPDAI
jgi:tungstate transport system substrate-binding protein